MPYGIPDTLWSTLPLDVQYNISVNIPKIPEGPQRAAAKDQLLAQLQAGTYWTPEVPGMATGDPMLIGGGGGGEAETYGGGYGSGGGAVDQRRALASSPEWLAYLNALGLEENQFRADIDRQRALMKSAADQQIGDLAPQYDQQRRGISGSLEQRGMTRSGEHLRKQAESRATQGRQVAGIQTGLAGQLGQLESSLANKLIDIGARKAQQELQLRTSGFY